MTFQFLPVLDVLNRMENVKKPREDSETKRIHKYCSPAHKPTIPREVVAAFDPFSAQTGTTASVFSVEFSCIDSSSLEFLVAKYRWSGCSAVADFSLAALCVKIPISDAHCNISWRILIQFSGTADCMSVTTYTYSSSCRVGPLRDRRTSNKSFGA